MHSKLSPGPAYLQEVSQHVPGAVLGHGGHVFKFCLTVPRMALTHSPTTLDEGPCFLMPIGKSCFKMPANPKGTEWRLGAGGAAVLC